MMISLLVSPIRSNSREDVAAGKQAIADLRTWIRAANADPPQNSAMAHTKSRDPKNVFFCVAESRNRV
jgi:hypothetical protein